MTGNTRRAAPTGGRDFLRSMGRRSVRRARPYGRSVIGVLAQTTTVSVSADGLA